jgi:16S rRNA processing protein RimM
MAIDSSGMDSSELLVIGKFTTFYGVQGWLKVHSFTEPMENLLDYPDRYVELNGRWQPLQLAAGKRHGKGLVARIEGVGNREQAQRYCNSNIAVLKTALPSLASDEYYWHQLEGLQVEAVGEQGEPVILGTLAQMMETGANDVMLVRGNSSSIDQQERLIPYLDHVVKSIDIEAGIMQVDWDPEF